MEVNKDQRKSMIICNTLSNIQTSNKKVCFPSVKQYALAN